MNSTGTHVVPPASEGRSGESGVQKGMPEVVRRKPLSHGRVMELVADLMSKRFYGKLALHFEAGHIVCAKLEQTIKE